MMCQCLIRLFIINLITGILIVQSFNVDNHNYAIFDITDNHAMFGFSVAIYKESDNGWLIVGAPEAQSEYQQQIYRGGAVFKCNFNMDRNCQQIPVDREGNHIESGYETDNKTGQWFGATVGTSGTENGRILVCAPRYSWYPKLGQSRDPVGTCYVSRDGLKLFDEYSPCRTYQWGYHRQGSCQAGFSAAINTAGNRLFVGAPGSRYWQGEMYSIDAHAKFEYKPTLFSATYGGAGQVYQQSLEFRPAVFSTKEGTPDDDDSYMGYSTIVGKFDDSNEMGVAVGMPRGGELLGKVLLFTWNLTNYKNFTSNQLGSYFGYALAASDVDGDGRIDLIVGAPMYTPSNNEGQYDVGAIYVIYQQSTNGRYVKSTLIEGFNTKSRFGQALATLNDINQDGYGDFAVGAPYDGPNGNGAVYIYHGSRDGVLKKYSQVIHAEDMTANRPIRTFGFSLSGGIDLDKNEYPDMAVGAYLSNTAFFFRSRPVVRVNASVNFLTPGGQVDIKRNNYQLRNGLKAIRTQIQFCVNYYGKGIPPSINLNLQYILDSNKPKYPRMGFIERENSNTINDTISLQKDTPSRCNTKDIYIKTDIADKLTALEAEVKYWMDDYYESSYRRDPRSLLRPILDLNSPPSRKDSIIIQKNCGADNICIPNLNLIVKSSVDQYLLGSKNELSFDVTVANHGEDSFETGFYVHYPDDVFYSHLEKIKADSHLSCITKGNNTLHCQIGNPLPANKIVRFLIYWQPDTRKDQFNPSFEFDLFVNSTNPEQHETLIDNRVHMSVSLWSDSKLELRGRSYPDEVFYNVSQYTSKEVTRESDLGPQVIHVYYLRNEGPTAIEETEMFFAWPTSTFGNDDLLYLLEQPQISGKQNVKCDTIPANQKHIEVDYKKSVWDRLNLHLNSNEINRLHSNGGVHVESGGVVTGMIGGKETKSQGTLDEVIGSSADASSVHQARQHTTVTTSSSSSSSSSGGRSGMGTIITDANSGRLAPGPAHTITQTTITSSGGIQENDNVMKNRQGQTVGTHSYDNQNRVQMSRGPDYVGGSNVRTGTNQYETRTSYGGGGQSSTNWQRQNTHTYQQGGGYDQGQTHTYNRNTQNVYNGAPTQHQTGGSYYESSSRNIPGGTSSFYYENRTTFNNADGNPYNNKGYRVMTYDLGKNHGQFEITEGPFPDGVLNNDNQNKHRVSEEEYHYERTYKIPITHKTYSVPSEDGVTERTSWYGRSRRQTYNPYEEIRNHIKCETTPCVYVRCTVGRMNKNDEIAIALRSRLNVRVLRNITVLQPVSISSMMAARISRLPHIGTPKDRSFITQEIITNIAPPETELKPDIVPLWVVILSAVAGTIILLLLILLLYKLGFFKRNRPSSAPERQPLNRNGYHHGDEAL